MITSIKDIDLAPKKGKRYWNDLTREWREDFIYFVIIDRFHDDKPRTTRSTAASPAGFGTAEQLKASCGGNLRGILSNLQYIADLGCTALWLSPVFENNPGSYHGYSIQNYLEVDPRFGTRADLEALVDKAHALNMRVYLDIVLHHSGDNWSYPGDYDYYYYEGARFDFGGWRNPDRPLPVELRDPELYARRGQIRNFDRFPEARLGDFSTLKAYRNDNSHEDLFVQFVMTMIHCYWIRETDIDGYRLDAVKHMGERAISRFCSYIREYAYLLGKRNFFLFGELVGGDELYDRYIGPKTLTHFGEQSLYYGLTSVLDFPLYFILSDVIKGVTAPDFLARRYEALQKSALRRGDFGEYLVSFIDNHDQVGQSFKHRLGYQAKPEQVIGGIAFLLFAIGTPCLYYGTEQGLQGAGPGDTYVRECLFDPSGDSDILDPESPIYRAISFLSRIRQKCPEARFGRMFFREVSTNGLHFHTPTAAGGTIAFSRVLFDRELLYIYNASQTEEKDEYILVDYLINRRWQVLHPVYGHSERLAVIYSEQTPEPLCYVKVHLYPLQLIVACNYENLQ